MESTVARLLNREVVPYEPVGCSTQQVPTRDGTDELAGLRCLGNAPCAALSFASDPSIHIPCGHLVLAPPPYPARGHLLPFRKIHLYGKTKKSTHHHTKSATTTHMKTGSASVIRGMARLPRGMFFFRVRALHGRAGRDSDAALRSGSSGLPCGGNRIPCSTGSLPCSISSLPCTGRTRGKEQRAGERVIYNIIYSKIQ